MEHHGPGFDASDAPVLISEAQYKRQECAASGLTLLVAVVVWWAVAKDAQLKRARADARDNFLEAQIDALSAYHRAFAMAIDPVLRDQAEAQAEISKDAYAAALKRNAMRGAYNAASRKLEEPQ